MRVAVVVLAAALACLAGATPASANLRECTRVAGDYEGGANAYLMWTNPYEGKQAGYTYQDAGLTCSQIDYPRHRFRRIWSYRRHHRHWAYHRPGWINIPIANRGGLCPKGDCGLLKDGARKHPA